MSTQTPPVDKRVARYPVVIEHPLDVYLGGDAFDHIARTREICETLKKKITNLLALDPQISIIQLFLGNNTSPDGNPETYDYAYIGVFFHNVTGSDLTTYADKINAELARDPKWAFSHPDGLALPAPEAYVPTYEWIKSQSAELNSLKEKTAGWYNEDGSVNTEVAQREAERVMEEVRSDTTRERLTVSPSRASSSTADVDLSDEALEDFDEFDLI